MIWIFGALAALFVLDALRLRGRLGALREIPRAVEDADVDVDAFMIVTAPGVEIDDQTKRDAVAYAVAEGLEVLDLVPGDLDVPRALSLGVLVDVPTYRDDALMGGGTAGHAVLISRDVALRSGVGASPEDPVAFARLASKLKLYAPKRADLAVARTLRAVPEETGKRLATTYEALGGAATAILAGQMLVYAAIIAGLAFESSRLGALIALGAFHLQPLLIVAFTRLRSRWLIPFTVLRMPWEIVRWVGTVTGRWRPADEDLAAQRRPEYERLLATDVGTLFEPRRETCPICAGENLKVRLRTDDLLQHKPGQFTLEKCSDCGHIFQNPRLSLDGLDFYYKDFYDGLGEKGMEFIFAFQPQTYRQRADMIAETAAPERWLDVGAGHGHFCCVAKDVFPNTEFDGLDLSESIDEAARRGWIDTAYRGLFPAEAPKMPAAYDVVSMSHYLEHTLDPRAELDAAHTALMPEGYLFIEVPNPQSKLGRLLGRYWIPWFQPQHQHLISTDNMDKLLREAGFEPVEWHRGEAHQQVDFLIAAFLFLARIAPPTDLPWRPKGGFFRKAWRVSVWTLGLPLILLGFVADKVLSPFVSRPSFSNTYRVLARKNA